MFLFSGNRLEATYYGYLLVQTSCSQYNKFSNSGQIGLAGSNELLKCCREFSFQYNGLLYCRACINSEAYTVFLAKPTINTGRAGHKHHSGTKTTLSGHVQTAIQYWKETILTAHPQRDEFLGYIGGVRLSEFIDPMSAGIFEISPFKIERMRHPSNYRTMSRPHTTDG